jgi:hypothetical protein
MIARPDQSILSITVSWEGIRISASGVGLALAE